MNSNLSKPTIVIELSSDQSEQIYASSGLKLNTIILAGDWSGGGGSSGGGGASGSWFAAIEKSSSPNPQARFHQRIQLLDEQKERLSVLTNKQDDEIILEGDWGGGGGGFGGGGASGGWRVPK